MATGILLLTLLSFILTVRAQCEGGWTHYRDDGSEGFDSCVALYNTDVLNWNAARTSCPSGSHLLTVKSGNPSKLLTLAFAMADGLAPGSYLFIGCRQLANATSRAAGWYWVDGTSASNLNCAGSLAEGGNGCGLWGAGPGESASLGNLQPDDSPSVPEDHQEDFCSLAAVISSESFLNDLPYSSTSIAGFICEQEIPDTYHPKEQRVHPALLFVGGMFAGAGLLLVVALLVRFILRRRRGAAPPVTLSSQSDRGEVVDLSTLPTLGEAVTVRSATTAERTGFEPTHPGRREGGKERGSLNSPPPPGVVLDNDRSVL